MGIITSCFVIFYSPCTTQNPVTLEVCYSKWKNGKKWPLIKMKIQINIEEFHDNGDVKKFPQYILRKQFHCLSILFRANNNFHALLSMSTCRTGARWKRKGTRVRQNNDPLRFFQPTTRVHCGFYLSDISLLHTSSSFVITCYFLRRVQR